MPTILLKVVRLTPVRRRNLSSSKSFTTSNFIVPSLIFRHKYTHKSNFERSLINELVSLESISPPRGGTEIESALKLFEQAAKTNPPIPLTLKALVTILSKEISSYGRQAKDIGVATGGSSAWNAY
jgi:hypothetical protein